MSSELDNSNEDSTIYTNKQIIEYMANDAQSRFDAFMEKAMIQNPQGDINCFKNNPQCYKMFFDTELDRFFQIASHPELKQHENFITAYKCFDHRIGQIYSNEQTTGPPQSRKDRLHICQLCMEDLNKLGNIVDALDPDQA